MDKIYCLIIFILIPAGLSNAQSHESIVQKAWAKTSVNTVSFRKNSLVTHEGTQFIAFYDSTGYVALAKRKLNTSNWEIKKTAYKGNVSDSHNAICIMADGDGFIHMAWDHHGHPLRYSKSTAPGSLEMSEKMMMTGNDEGNVTYPEFHRLPTGDLMFLYRSGMSGQGNLVMKRYSTKDKKWNDVHPVLIDGEGQRNAYWQSCIDTKGIIHLSWVWRETWDVSTNHDLCYAQSTDGGITWKKSSGEVYALPITASTAEYAAHIPQKSELINQTSMYADSEGRPYITTYWRNEGSTIPQYQLVYHDGQQWKQQTISQRKTPFSLSGGGTKKIPISRPQIVIKTTGKKTSAYLIFRDTERGSKVSIAATENLKEGKWTFSDLTSYSVGDWEPTYDTELWKTKNILHLFVERVGQGDGEKLEEMKPQQVSVLEWKP